jgi:UDP-N-acetyl-D-mannosaminuronic acid transferase (WecB/TagA/CpsF family)
MQRYSITKTGKQYVVQANGEDVLLCKSRRDAEQMISDASGFLEESASKNQRRKDRSD